MELQSGLQCVSAITRVSAVQRCPLTEVPLYITFGVVNACMLSAKQTKLKNKVTPINFDRLTLHDLVKLCIVPQVYSTDHQGFSLQPAMLQWCIEDVCAWMLHVHKH